MDVPCVLTWVKDRGGHTPDAAVPVTPIAVPKAYLRVWEPVDVVLYSNQEGKGLSADDSKTICLVNLASRRTTHRFELIGACICAVFTVEV